MDNLYLSCSHVCNVNSQHSISIVGLTAFGALWESPDSSAFPHGKEGPLFKVFFFHLVTQSTRNLVGIKPGYSSVVTGYQVDEFTFTWLAVFCYSITHLFWVHRQGFSTKPLLTWTRVWGSFILDQGVADFKYGHDFIFTDSVIVLELDASFDKTDVMTASVSSEFLCLNSILSDDSKLQLGPSIKSCQLRC